jgi:phosphoglycolate phosphatase-like HAD superfamily hydrolase
MGVACPPAEDLTWVLGPPSRRSFPKLIGPERDVEEAVRLYREHYEANGLFNGAVYPGMAQALTTLHALPARLFVCTAKPQGFAEKIIAHFGLAHLFDGIYGVDLEGRLDDKGLLIEHIIGVEQIDPARTIMVGDRANDMLAAARHGIQLSVPSGAMAMPTNSGRLAQRSCARHPTTSWRWCKAYIGADLEQTARIDVGFSRARTFHAQADAHS